MIFVLDNYDSFTWNLAQYLMELGAEVVVKRNDRVTCDEVLASGCRSIVISPGPGRPEAAGITMDLIRRAAGRVPLLGVCLGHQAIGQVYGARVVRASRLMHGKTSQVTHDGRGVFEGLPDPFEATRYHSLVVEPASMPAELAVSATTRDGAQEVIMGLRHREYPDVFLEGVQFHPESILTLEGRRLLGNFLKQVDACCARS
ncbi:MAG TPA: aminodeoxychorismate/anthranilate synthase component II [Candidatus Polarisedimenticolia bacterium]|nr:aminodeoxychorismate/anthranilate synthase component II [Candidatus Polarisedimenticolia bacterium]